MTTVDGEIYGMPSRYCSPKVMGWDVDVRVFEEYGLKVEDFYGQFWEMDDTFAKVYEKNGGRAFLYLPGDKLNYGEYNDSYMPQIIYAQLCYQFKQITSCFAIDYTAETPQLVNYLETDYIRATQQAIARYEKVLGNVETAQEHVDGIVRPFIEQANRQADETLDSVQAVLAGLLAQLGELQGNVEQRRQALHRCKADSDSRLSAAFGDWLGLAQDASTSGNHFFR